MLSETRNFRFSKVQSIQERRKSVEKLLGFEISAFFRHLHGEGKKGGNYKHKKFFNWVALFLYWLCFSVFLANSLSFHVWAFPCMAEHTERTSFRMHVNFLRLGSLLMSDQQITNPQGIRINQHRISRTKCKTFFLSFSIFFFWW